MCTGECKMSSNAPSDHVTFTQSSRDSSVWPDLVRSSNFPAWSGVNSSSSLCANTWSTYFFFFFSNPWDHGIGKYLKSWVYAESLKKSMILDTSWDIYLTPCSLFPIKNSKVWPPCFLFVSEVRSQHFAHTVPYTDRPPLVPSLGADTSARIYGNILVSNDQTKVCLEIQGGGR